MDSSEPLGIVGEKAVDAERDQARHRRLIVYRPDVNPSILTVRVSEKERGEHVATAKGLGYLERDSG